MYARIGKISIRCECPISKKKEKQISLLGKKKTNSVLKFTKQYLKILKLEVSLNLLF